VTSGFSPEVGGVEAYVRNLAHELHRLNCEVDVITQCPKGKGTEWGSLPQAVPGVSVLRFDDWTGSRQFRVAPALWKYLRQNRRQYDVVHAHNFHGSPAWMAAMATDCRFVFTPYYHGGGHTPSSKLLHRPYDVMARRILKRASFVLCVSDAERSQLVRDYPTVEGRTYRVGIGVDIEGIVNAVPFELDQPVVLVTGRLEAYKQVERVIEAFALCSVDAQLIVIGTGPLKDQIAGRVHQLGIDDRVQMLGRLDDASTRRWQRSAKTVVSLSTSESFGLGIAEAVVAGARVVVSDIPAHREVSSMSGGVFEFVPADADADDIATALGRALSAPPPIGGEWTVPSWREVARLNLDYYEKAVSAATI